MQLRLHPRPGVRRGRKSRARPSRVDVVRICLVYDHLYPVTVGGGERWMHDLASALVDAGHDVTYLTMRHWNDADPPVLRGVRILGLARPGATYISSRRAFVPPVRFGLAVGRHLLAHGGEFDVVHTAAFPYFPLLAASVARRRHGYRLVADWYEVWTRSYWQRYAGSIPGAAGWLVQRLCIHVRHDAFCISRHTARRLVAEGFRGPHTVLPGLYAGPVAPSPSEIVEPLVVYAGRHVKEKRIPLLVQGFALARRELPDLRLEVYGDGPESGHVRDETARLGLRDAVVLLGSRPQSEIESAFARAACIATASEREGYGLVVVEAAARGTPAVVVEGADNAATELVVEGVNGRIARRPTPEAIGRAIVETVRGGQGLRKSTQEWFAEHAAGLRLERSLDVVLQAYAGVSR